MHPANSRDRMQRSAVNWDRRFHLLTVCPILFLIAGFIGYAGVTLIRLSLERVNTFNINLGQFVGLHNYATVLSDQQTWMALENSLIWILGVVLATTVLGVAAGLFLSRETRIVRVTRSFMLLPWVLPGVVAAATWKWLYQTNNGIFNMILIKWGLISFGIPWLGQISTALPSVMLAMVWRIFPLFALVVASATKTIDMSLYEAARLDGANRWQLARYITLPGIGQQVTTMVLVTTIWVANNLVFVQVVTGGGPSHASEILPTLIYELAFSSNDIGRSAVVSVINAAIIGFIGVLYIRVLRTASEADR